MRSALHAAEPKEVSHLSKRCVQLLDKALAIWPNAVLKFQYFEKMIEKCEDKPETLYTGLEIIKTLLDRNMMHAIAQNHNAVHQLLKTCLSCDKPKVIDSLCNMVTKYLDVQAPINKADAITQFIGWLKELIEQGLQHVSTQSSQLSKEERASIHNAERILQALNAKAPEIVDEHAQQIVKVVHRFSKEHCQLIQAERSRARQPLAQPESVDGDVQESTTRILVMGIQLLSTRLNMLNDHRKTFLNAITFLIERCPQIERGENQPQVTHAHVCNDSFRCVL